MTGTEVRPTAKVWWAFDLAPGTASAWILTYPDRSQRVMIPVSGEVARAIGMQPLPDFGFKPLVRKLANLPELLEPYMVLALTDEVRRPENHPLATWVMAH